MYSTRPLVHCMPAALSTLAAESDVLHMMRLPLSIGLSGCWSMGHMLRSLCGWSRLCALKLLC